MKSHARSADAREACGHEYAARGLRQRHTLYRQSALAGQVCELATYLAMVAPLGELLRCPTFKEKARRYPDHVSYGLAGYPVLMAADILLLNAERVPVRRDQLPQLELARSIARRFNRRFGPLFVEPHPVPTPFSCPRYRDGTR